MPSARARWALGSLAALATVVTGCGSITQPGPGATSGTTASPRVASPGMASPGAASAGVVPPVNAAVKHAGFLNGVSCVSASECVAVGSYYSGAAGPSHTLALRWNGRTWQMDSSPSQGRDSRLSSVSCASATDCVAVGSPAEVWTGARWAITGGSSPASSVSCTAPASCQAVGVSPAGRLVALRWDGHLWQGETMPRPPPAAQNITLAGISCTSASFCVAVGDDSSGAGARPSPTFRDRTLAEVWAGARWRLAATPSPSHSSKLSGVSCVSPRACVAVGASASGQRTLAERWNGTRWTIQRTPNLNRVGYTALTGVSCAGAASCTAVGSYDGGMAGIAEHWTGGRWTIERLPSPPGQAFLGPVAVSCASPADCMAVGSSGSTLADVWNGRAWTVTAPPNPR